MSGSSKTTDVGDLWICCAECCAICGFSCTFPQCIGCICDGMCLCCKSQMVYCKLQDADKRDDAKLCICSEGGFFCVTPSTCIQLQAQFCCLESRCALPCTEQVPCICTCLPGCIVCAEYEMKSACCQKVKDVIEDSPQKNEAQWDLTAVDVSRLRVCNACCCSICSLFCQFPQCIGGKSEATCVCCQCEEACCKIIREENDDNICCVLCDGGAYFVEPSTCIQCTEQCCCIDSRCAIPCTDKVPCFLTCLPGCLVGAHWRPKLACCPLIGDIKKRKNIKTELKEIQIVPSQVDCEVLAAKPSKGPLPPQPPPPHYSSDSGTIGTGNLNPIYTTPAVPKRYGMDAEEIEDASERLKPLAEFIESPPPGHEPETTCASYVRNMEEHLPGVKFLDEAIEACTRITDSIRTQASAHSIGNLGMVFAIVLYTFDLCLIKPSESVREDNFYFVLNAMLRKRSPAFSKAAHGFLYFLMTGLSRLPSATGHVYRGIDRAQAQAVRKKFLIGRRFHFSSFSSTSPSMTVAKEFAAGGGIVLRIRLPNRKSKARDIQDLSAFGGQEAETLLLPNIKTTVVGSVMENGVEIIDLVEEMEEDVMVDF